MKSYYGIENCEYSDNEKSSTLSEAKSYARFGFSDSEKAKLFNGKAHAQITHFVEYSNKQCKMVSVTPFVFENGVTKFDRTKSMGIILD